MDKEKELVLVYAGNSLEAGLIKGILEDAGIAVFLKDEIVGTIAPFCVTPGGAGAIKVLVLKKDSDRAKTLIQEFLERNSGN